MGFLTDLFSGGVGSLVKSVGDVIDQTTTSDEERITLENEIYKADLEYKTEIRKLDIKETELYLEDTASAREEHTKVQESENSSWMAKNIQPLLAIVVIVVTFVMFAQILFGDNNPEESTIIMMILGSLVTIDTQIVSYYFGASRDVESKNTRLSEDFQKKLDNRL